MEPLSLLFFAAAYAAQAISAEFKKNKSSSSSTKSYTSNSHTSSSSSTSSTSSLLYSRSPEYLKREQESKNSSEYMGEKPKVKETRMCQPDID